jgi:hypothetical protein
VEHLLEAKVVVLRDSHNLVLTPNGEFECNLAQQVTKTVLAGLRLNAVGDGR